MDNETNKKEPIIWITYIHKIDKTITHPVRRSKAEEFKKWLIESGEAVKILETYRM
jgi:hypothetical protein